MSQLDVLRSLAQEVWGTHGPATDCLPWAWAEELLGSSDSEGTSLEQRKQQYTSHILFLDAAALALLLAPDGREDIALCNAMARCLASLPWVKALQYRLEFEAQEHSTTMRYRSPNPMLGFQLWDYHSWTRYLREAPRETTVLEHVIPSFFFYREKQQSMVVDTVNLILLGVLGFEPSSTAERAVVLAAAIATGQRDLFAIVSAWSPLEDLFSSSSQQLYSEILVRAASCCPHEQVVRSVVISLLSCPNIEENALQTIVFSVCQMGYLAPLKVVRGNQKVTSVRRLLQRGYDGECRLRHFSADIGFYPIHFACKGDTLGNVAVIKYLVEEHCTAVNDEERDQSWSPLHVAAYFGCMNVMRYLLEQCPTVAYVNAADLVNGETPLIVAVGQRRVEVVRCLLAHGADGRSDCHRAGIARVNALEYALCEAEDDFKQDIVVDVQSLLPIVHLLYEAGGCRVRMSEHFSKTALPEAYHPFVARIE